jgi:exodeoxyribonuclease VII large subunit
MEIANFPLPVITGIGHEIDNTIADVVANISLKTPTAVANFIIDKSQFFEANLISIYDEILIRIKQILLSETERLYYLYSFLEHKPKSIIEKNKLRINHLYQNIIQTKTFIIQNEKRNLEAVEKIIKANAPEKVLKKGFVLIKDKDNYITSIKDLKKIEKAEVIFHDGNGDIKYLS